MEIKLCGGEGRRNSGSIPGGAHPINDLWHGWEPSSVVELYF